MYKDAPGFPGKWRKWSEIWADTRGHNKAATGSYLKAIGLCLGAVYLFVAMPLTMFSLIIIGGLLLVASICRSNAKFRRWQYFKDDGPVCAIERTKWFRMGGTDFKPPDDVIKARHLTKEWPWVEKGFEYTVKNATPQAKVTVE